MANTAKPEMPQASESCSNPNAGDTKTALQTQKRSPPNVTTSNQIATPTPTKETFSISNHSHIFSHRPTKSMSSGFEPSSSINTTPSINLHASHINSDGHHTFPTYPLPRLMPSAMQESPTPQSRSALNMYFPESPPGVETMHFYSTREIEELKNGLEWYKANFKEAEDRVEALTAELRHANRSLNRVRKEREILEKENIYVKAMYENEKSRKNTTPSGSLSSPEMVVAELHKRLGPKKVDADSIYSSDSAMSFSNNSTSKSPEMFSGMIISPQVKSPDLTMTSMHYQVDRRSIGPDSSANDVQNLHKADNKEDSVKQEGYLRNEPVWFFRQLFESTLGWAQRFAVLPIDIANSPQSSSPTKSFIDAIVSLTQSLNFDDVLQSIRLRPTLIAGVMNVHIVEIMSSSTLASSRGYDCDESKELAMINAELSRKTGRSSTTATHAMLQRRSAIWTEVSKDPKFWDWVQRAIDSRVESNFHMFRPMIPQEMHQNAFDTLYSIFRNVYSLAINMKKLPKEWDVVNAERSDRWIPETMDQKDVGLNRDSRLRLNNGFQFTVRYGVAPSIIEKDHSTGIVRAFQRHRQQVIVMQSSNSRREPRKSISHGQGNKGKHPAVESRPV